jgi:hypothetical protein
MSQREFADQKEGLLAGTDIKIAFAATDGSYVLEHPYSSVRD